MRLKAKYEKGSNRESRTRRRRREGGGDVNIYCHRVPYTTQALT
jgi:hypothetical protein